jgi:hypothetical protein
MIPKRTARYAVKIVKRPRGKRWNGVSAMYSRLKAMARFMALQVERDGGKAEVIVR